VEVRDLVSVKYISHRWLMEGVLVVEDVLLEGVDSVFILLGGECSLSLPVGNGLKESIGNLAEEGCVDVIVDLECGDNHPRGHHGDGWGSRTPEWEWHRQFAWRLIGHVE
jgi:hypothetical protein